MIEFKLMNSNSKTPTRMTSGSAAFDLYSSIDGDCIRILPGKTKLIHTGVAISMSDNSLCAMLIARSGWSIKYGVTLINGVGLIDSDYQGEIMAALHNFGDSDAIIMNHDRICQIVFLNVVHPLFKKVSEFSVSTDRGSNGIGSTGR